MANIWFTSDCHYGHKNIAGPKISSWDKGFRDFESVDEMNDRIVDSLKVIAPDDILYYLGDWSFGGRQNIEIFRKRIACKNIYFVLGNRDQHIYDNRALFSWVKPIFEGKINKEYFFLHHYAQKVWNHSHAGSIHLYGHSHGTLPDDPMSQSIDVGWDTYLYGHEKYTPYSYEEILSIMSKKGFAPVDHHNERTT